MKTGSASACTRHIVSALIYNATTICIVYVFLLWWHGSHDVMIHEKFRRPRPMSEEAAARFGMQLGAYKCAAWARLGTMADGGWTVCLDPLLPALGLATASKSALKSATASAATATLPDASCLVYSFGVGAIDGQTTFDRAASALGCTVHMFDPSIGLARHTVAPRLEFHAIGIWHEDTVLPAPRGWTLHTLDSIAAQLGHAHRTIDILKIDVEEAEWRALPQIFASKAAWFARGRVRQLLMEVHFADATLATELAVLHRLNEFGYQLVNRDENWRHSAPMQTASPMFGCLELTYVYVGVGK